MSVKLKTEVATIYHCQTKAEAEQLVNASIENGCWRVWFTEQHWESADSQQRFKVETAKTETP